MGAESEDERAGTPRAGQLAIGVRRASVDNPADAVALIEEYCDAIHVVLRDEREAIMAYLSDPNCAIWVAYQGEYPAGCILYRPLPDLPAAGEMKRLYVRPAYRGRGIAGLLLREVEVFARRRGDRWLYLDTKDDLAAAIAFYRRHNYEECRRYNNNPQATIFMRKQLDGGGDAPETPPAST